VGTQVSILFVGALLLVSTGCASITKGTKGVTQVQIENCSEAISCEATNKKGSWEFDAPGPVQYKKSDEEMAITCDDGAEKLTTRMLPTKSAMVWGNVLVGGIIGGGVDASTDAHWEYPETITLHRKYCNGVAVEPAAANPDGTPVALPQPNPSEATNQPVAN
jgi:hypothetical protein